MVHSIIMGIRKLYSALMTKLPGNQALIDGLGPGFLALIASI